MGFATVFAGTMKMVLYHLKIAHVLLLLSINNTKPEMNAARKNSVNARTQAMRTHGLARSAFHFAKRVLLYTFAPVPSPLLSCFAFPSSPTTPPTPKKDNDRHRHPQEKNHL